MTRVSRHETVADDIEAIETLMRDLEKRLRRLGGVTRSEATGASNDISDFVTDALAGIMRRVRESAGSVSDSVTDEAARIGSQAFRKLSDELEHRPLVMLGVAAGLGYLVGLAGRRSS
ncbi:MAG TPA: hypothetical protein VFB45_01860 [Pseudolabrys sp.]|nr:hypothetical protein [Pseudolabrys sp.]